MKTPKFTIFALTFCLLLSCNQSVSEQVTLIKDYAEQFQPKANIEKGEEHKRPSFAFTERPDQRVLMALNALSSKGSREHEKYVILIFLRHYRAQVELAHQSYELREPKEVPGEPSNPLVKEFCRLININPKGREFLSSGLAHSWVETHPELNNYSAIKDEMDRIEKVNTEIESELERIKREKASK